jgi:hypothetical protein
VLEHLGRLHRTQSSMYGDAARGETYREHEAPRSTVRERVPRLHAEQEA